MVVLLPVMSERSTTKDDTYGPACSMASHVTLIRTDAASAHGQERVAEDSQSVRPHDFSLFQC